MELQQPVSPGEETQNPAPELTAEQPEVAEPETNEAESQDEKPAEDPLAKTVKRMERRIDRATAARYQAEARAQALEAQLQALQQREQQYEPQEQPQADPVAMARLLRDLDKVTEKSNQVAAEGNKRFGADFQNAVAQVIEEAGPLVLPVAPGAKVGKPTPLGEAILEADDPAAVLHYLGTNPDAAAELHGLSAIQVARKIAKIEAELSKPAAPKVSNAPKPISPTKPVARDGGKLSDDLPIDEWARRFYAMRKG